MVLPIVVALWQRNQLNQPLRVFLWYRIFAVFFNLIEQTIIWLSINRYPIIGPYLKYWDIYDTNFLGILYYLNDYIFLCWFFYLLFGRKPYGVWIGVVAMLLLVSNLINYCFIESYHVYGFFNPTSDTIFILGVAAFYLWHLYKSQLLLPLTKNPYFWITFGLILPQIISFFLFIVGNITSKENFTWFVTMSIGKDGFVILAQIFYAIAFWRAHYARFIPLPSQEKTA